MLRKMNIWEYLYVVAFCLLAAAAAVMLVKPGFAQRSMDMLTMILTAAAAVIALAACYISIKLYPVLPPVFTGAALGLSIYHGAPIIMDKINGLNFQNGDFASVVLSLALIGTAGMLECISAFCKE